MTHPCDQWQGERIAASHTGVYDWRGFVRLNPARRDGPRMTQMDMTPDDALDLASRLIDAARQAITQRVEDAP